LVGITTALAVGRLYRPDIVIILGCIQMSRAQASTL
jgi:hypothetical protein